MATITPQQGLPVPEAGDDPNVAEDITNLALAIEKKLVGVYADAVDRNAKVSAPLQGQVALIRATNQMHFWDGATWKQIYPPVIPSFTAGSAAPSNASGNEGDVYFRL